MSIKRCNLQFNTSQSEKLIASTFLDKIEGRKKSTYVSYLIVRHLEQFGIKSIEELNELTPERINSMFDLLVSGASTTTLQSNNEMAKMLDIIKGLIDKGVVIQQQAESTVDLTRNADIVHSESQVESIADKYSVTETHEEKENEQFQIKSDDTEFELDMDDVSNALGMFM